MTCVLRLFVGYWNVFSCPQYTLYTLVCTVAGSGTPFNFLPSLAGVGTRLAGVGTRLAGVGTRLAGVGTRLDETGLMGPNPPIGKSQYLINKNLVFSGCNGNFDYGGKDDFYQFED
jgi:hypothetical protein